MNIVAINGSHRGKKGYNHFLIDKIFKGATENGADCEEILLSKSKINICKACQVCTKKNHFLKCIYDEKDDVKSIFEKMAKADIIIYATPIYVMNLSALMKTFLDRIYSTGDCNDHRLSKSGLFFHHITKEIYSKPFILLVTQDNIENETSKNVISYFKTFSKFMDAPQVGTIIRRSGKLIGYGKDSEKEKKYPKIEAIHKGIEKVGKELVLYGKIKRSTERVINQDIIDVPLFSLLKNFKWFKKIAIKKMET